MKYFLLLLLVVVVSIGFPRGVAADDLEAYDNAVAACMDVIAPGYVQFLMTGEIPEGKTFQDIMVAKEDFNDLSLCLEANGFKQNNLTDFSVYGEVMPDKQAMQETDITVNGMAKQPSATTRTTVTPKNNPVKEQVIEGNKAPPLYVPLDKQGKSKKYIYIPD